MVRETDQHPEILRMRNLLHVMFRLLNYSYREVEQKLNLGLGHYSKMFGGSRDFRLEHIYEFCQMSGLHPAEFFHRIYPQVPGKRSDADRKVAEAQSALSGSAGEAAAEPENPFLVLKVDRKRYQNLSAETQRVLADLIYEEGMAAGE